MAIDADPDEGGIVDRLYVGDTGGVVWRVDLATDLNSDNRGDWTLEPILSVGRHAADQPDRRFFHRPDAVFTSDTYGSFTAVLIGSGDRPHAKSAIHTDRFFMVKDRIPDGNFTNLKTVDILNDITIVTETVIGDTGNSIFTTAASADCGGDTICENRQKNGWYLDLPDAGEKVLSSSLTFEGKTTFTTYVPNIGANTPVGVCGPSEGLSYTYTVALDSGLPVYGNTIAGTRSEGREITGAGIGSDPVVVILDGSIFIGPGNLGHGEGSRGSGDGGGGGGGGGGPCQGNSTRDCDGEVTNDSTFWYEEEL